MLIEECASAQPVCAILFFGMNPTASLRSAQNQAQLLPAAPTAFHQLRPAHPQRSCNARPCGRQ